MTRATVAVRVFACVFLALPAAAPQAGADALALRVRLDGTISGETHSQEAGPAPSGALFLEHEWTGGTNLAGDALPIARAALDDDGRAAALADAIPSAPGSADAAQAVTVWSRTVTNSAMHPVPYVYDIHGPVLEVVNTNTPESPSFGYAVYEYAVYADGQVVFHSAANLDARDRMVSPTGAVFPSTMFSNGPHHTGVRFGDTAGEVSLGELMPGQAMTVDVRAEVYVTISGSGIGGRAEWGDPLDLVRRPGVVSAVVRDLPVAAAPVTWTGAKSLFRGASGTR